ncbi:MAG: NADPH-dependent oxidoreductase [Ardenticatenaceae bacterium]|nr:NADPH-dependent oxidoreductase [Ardenticatenaceae bacterium]
MKLEKTVYTTAVTQTLNQHASVRKFTGEPVPDGMLHAILDAARRSPTSSNMQTYSIIIVRSPETRQKLAVLAGDQKHVEQCDVFVGFLADLHRLDVASQMHGETLTKNLETTLVATIDAALVGMSVQTAAESFGLGAVMVGAMRNHPQAVADLLGFPSGVYMVYGMSIGWPAEDAVAAELKPRLPKALVVHHEQYNQTAPRPLIKEYDAQLADYYGQQDRNQHPAAWSGPIAKRLKKPVRPHLCQALKEMGFQFD